MNALVSTLPARTVGRDHAAPTFLDTLSGFFIHSTFQMMAQPRTAVHTHVPSVAAVGSFTPESVRSGVIRSNAPDRARHYIGKPSRSSTAPTGSQSRPPAVPGAADSQTTLHPSILRQLLMRMEFAMSSIHSPLLSHSLSEFLRPIPVKRRPVRAFFTRLAHAWRLARGRLTEEDALALYLQCQNKLGWYTLDLLTTSDAIEAAREVFDDNPELPRLIAEACATVGQRWNATENTAKARERVFELAETLSKTEDLLISFPLSRRSAPANRSRLAQSTLITRRAGLRKSRTTPNKPPPARRHPSPNSTTPQPGATDGSSPTSASIPMANPISKSKPIYLLIIWESALSPAIVRPGIMSSKKPGQAALSTSRLSI